MTRQTSADVKCIDCGATGTVDVGEDGGYSVFKDTHGWTFRSAEGWLCPEDRDPTPQWILDAVATTQDVGRDA